MLCHPRKSGGNKCIILNVNYVDKSFTFYLNIRPPQSRKSAALGVQDLYANPVITAAEYILTPGALVYSSSWDSNNLVA